MKSNQRTNLLIENRTDAQMVKKFPTLMY